MTNLSELLFQITAANTASPAVLPISRKAVTEMLDNNTIERLKAMKMNAFAAELERQIADSDSYSRLGFEERMGLLVDSEWNRRQNNKLNRYIKNARFSVSSASMEGIEYI